LANLGRRNSDNRYVLGDCRQYISRGKRLTLATWHRVVIGSALKEVANLKANGSHHFVDGTTLSKTMHQNPVAHVADA